MRDWWKWCQEYRIFMIVLLVMDLFTGGFLWLMDAKAFKALFLLFLGSSILLFVIGVGLSIYKEKRRQENLWSLFRGIEENCEPVGQEYAEWMDMPSDKREVYQFAYDRIWRLEQDVRSQMQKRREYEDYIEMWAHEIKVPLSLMTLVLENRRQDMSPAVYEKMNYSNRRIQEDVTQILYYARLKAICKDYMMERIALRPFCEDVVEEYQRYTDGTAVEWHVQVENELVLTDRKGLQFMLGQILNNACKYIDTTKEHSVIGITSFQQKDMVWLQVKDNGLGAAQEELPFLFDKGFTGMTVAGQAKATGMGLYLVAKMAKDLALQLDVESQVGESFTIRIGFPVIYR